MLVHSIIWGPNMWNPNRKIPTRACIRKNPYVIRKSQISCQSNLRSRRVQPDQFRAASQTFSELLAFASTTYRVAPSRFFKSHSSWLTEVSPSLETAYFFTREPSVVVATVTLSTDGKTPIALIFRGAWWENTIHHIICLPCAYLAESFQIL